MLGVILEKESIVRAAHGIDFLNKKAYVDISGSIEKHKYKKIVKRVDIANILSSIGTIWENYTIVEFDYVIDLQKTIKLKGVFSWDDTEGRWGIDFDKSFTPYIFLHYNDTFMSNFEIIGNVSNGKKKLVK